MQAALVDDIEVKYRTLEPPICWEQLFENSRPVEVEVGFGKCGFLLNVAAQYPEVNFLGIESARKYYRKGIVKVRRVGLTNVKLSFGEARHVFQRYIPDESVQQVYVNFPDPWPKRRHAKRRLLSREFATVLAQKLVSSGHVDIATDAEPYSRQIREVFQTAPEYDPVYDEVHRYREPFRPYASDYELMFLNEGKPIYYFKYRRQ